MITVILFFGALIVRSVVAPKSGASVQAAPAGASGMGGGPGGGAQGGMQGGQPQGNAQGGSQGGARQNSNAAAQSGARPANSNTAQSGTQSANSNTAQSGQRQSGAARNATVVRAAAVVPGTVETGVVINGDVLAGTQISLYPSVSGRLAETRLQVGDPVRAGQAVAMVDPSKPGEVYSLSPVVSTISGTVLQKPLSPGDMVGTSSVVYVVGDLSTLVLETFVPERYSTAMRLGLSAQVSFEAMPGETFVAAVSELSPVLDPASRTLRIRLRFQGRADPRIRAGMFATVSLVTESRGNVPVIPRSSVINTYGSWIVFVVKSENSVERREIKMGLENEETVEVQAGLSIGELVVTAGQNFLSDGDLVRVVD
jgi:multidrug efflux pump subunit AcrA (membrane-fusion protein)